MEDNRLKILHVVSWFGPPYRGGTINRFNYLKRMGSFYRQYFIILRREEIASEISNEAIHEMGIECEGFISVASWEIGNADRIRGLLDRFPPGVAFYKRSLGASVRQAISSAVSRWKPNAMVVWSPNLAEVCSDVAPIPAVLYACDSMQLVNSSIARTERNILSSWYHRLNAARYALYEQQIYPKYKHVIFIGERDRNYCNLPSCVRTSVIPNGVDMEMFYPSHDKFKLSRPVLVFHGSLDYIANTDAVERIVMDLGTAMVAAYGNDGFEVRIIGKGAPALLIDLQRKRPWLRFLGYVEDLTSALNGASCYVAPIMMGGGMKTKILDAMACGLPVVGTKEAFSSLDITPGVHAILTPVDEFARAVVELLKDPRKQSKIGEAAYAWVSENASWSKMVNMMAEVIAETACGEVCRKV